MSELIFKNFINTTQDERLQILTWRNSDRIREKMLDQNIISQEEHLNWIENLKNKQDRLYFLVYIDKKPIGVVDFTSLDFINKTGSFGYYTAEEYTLYAPLLEVELLKYFFCNLNFEKMKISVLENNGKVYSNHKKFFNFEDINCIYDANIKQKVFNLELSKQTWKNRDISFDEKLHKILKIQTVVWE